MKISRILCPSDFSENSERALTYAVELAAGCGASVEILHVFERRAYVAPPGQPHTDSGARQYFDRLRGQLLESLQKSAAGQRRQDVPITYSTCEGVADEEIADRSGDFDLVVMATHSRTGAARFFFGSVVSRVMAHAQCPVLTVPGATPPPPSVPPVA